VTLHWSWGLGTAILLSYVIWLNGQGYRLGWALGAVVQLVNMSFGVAYGQWTFAFLIFPALMFVSNWLDHPHQVLLRMGKRAPCGDTFRAVVCDRPAEHDGMHTGATHGTTACWGNEGQGVRYFNPHEYRLTHERYE
jgi:hypothetical protein